MASNLADPTDGTIPLHETDPAAGLIQATMARAARETNGLIAEDVTEPLVRLADVLKDWRHTHQSLADVIAGSEQFYGNTVTKSIRSGARSLGNMLPFMAAAVATRNPMLSLAGAGLNTFGQSAGQALDKGLNPAKSLAYGATNSAIEVATEAIPAIRFIGDLKAGPPLLTMLTNNLKAEVPGELIATTLQNFTEWAVLNPDEPFSSYLKELPGAWVETTIATLTMGLGTAGIYGAVNRFTRQKTEDEKKAEAAKKLAQLWGELNKLSAADKLLQRAPETYQEWVAQNAPEGAVFIDSQVLMQSGLGEQLAQISPSVAEQLPTAAELGSAVAIPIEEYAARIAPTELSKPLLEHLRADPEGFSLAEAKEYYQNAPQAYREQIDKLTAEIEEGEAFRQSADAVFDQIKGELDNLKRFTPEANTAYASLVTSFFATHAKKLGVTPEALWKEYAFTVRNEGGQGQYEQPLNAGVNLDTRVPVIPVTPQFQGQNPKIVRKRFPEAIRESVLSTFKKGVMNEQTGITVSMSGNDFTEHLHFKDDATGDAHLEAIAVLPELMQSASLVESHPGKKAGDEENLKQVHRFISALRVGNKDYSVMLTVKEFKDGTTRLDTKNPVRLYHHRVEKSLSSVTSASVPIEQAGSWTTPEASEYTIRDLLSGVKDAYGKPYFQFIGEQGAASLDRIQEATIRIDNLAVAREMETAGKDAKAIKLATGWERGADGKWRYEISDITFKSDSAKIFIDNYAARDEEIGELWKKSEDLSDDEFDDVLDKIDAIRKEYERNQLETTLGDIVDAPELFAAYPELRNITIGFGEMPEGVGAYYVPKDKAIVLSRRIFWTEKSGILPSNRSELSHEIQHAIQDIEGFARGSSPDEFSNKFESYADAKREYAKVAGEVEARNVQKRLGMSEEERRKSLAAETEGVAREDQIFLYDSLTAQSRQNTDSPRGSFNPETFAITLNKNADFSTFLHEGGHFFLEVQMDMAEKIRQEMLANGPENVSSEKRQIVSDADALFKWFGIRDMQEWQSLTLEQKRPYHEQFARGFERYLAEGYSPNLEMRSIFQTFKDWLTRVYQDLTQLNVELSDEVRSVFDRMLATQEEITTAEQARSLIPLFATAEEAGLSEDAFREYQAMGRLPTEEACNDSQNHTTRHPKISRFPSLFSIQSYQAPCRFLDNIHN